MKKRISLFFCVLSLVMCFLALGCSAMVFSPDSDGTYTVELNMQNAGDYIMFILKGEYDQTNYIEAFNAADDSEILYFEQQTSDSDGVVSFGPFVPGGYYDSTVIIGGKGFDIPYLAGHLSANNVSNSASIEIYGVDNSYTVRGVEGADYIVNVETEVYDSFGYPSVTNEKVTVELEDNLEGVSVDGNVVTISKTAKAQVFRIVAKAGDATKSVFVEIKRETSVAAKVAVYSDGTYTEEVDSYSVFGTQANRPSVTVYAKTFDQYNDPIEDSYRYEYYGETVGATFVPLFRDETLYIQSLGGADVKMITVSAREIPDYKDSALELYNLINACRAKLSEEKNISVDGKDVFPESNWIKQENVDAFSAAINTANTAIRAYGQEGYYDTDYADELAALEKALSDYNSSFKAGIRVDITSITLKDYDGNLMVNGTLTLEAVTSPKIGAGLANDVLTWTSSDESVVTVASSSTYKASVKGVASGTATVTVTTRGGLTASAEITVIKKATDIIFSTNSSTATFGSEPTVLKAQLKPTGCTDIITWTVDKPDVADLEYNEYIDENGFRIIEATVLPKSAGKIKVTVNALYGEKSASKEITVVMPAWETAAAPVANVASGSILPGTVVALSTETANTQIYYTLDGTTPSKTNGRLYKSPVAINQTLTLKAVAMGEELYDSEVVTYEYLAVNSSVWVTKTTVTSGSNAVVKLYASEIENAKNVTIVVEYDAENLEVDGVMFEVFADFETECVYENGKITVTLSSENGFTLNEFCEIAEIYVIVGENVAEGEYALSITQASIELVDGKTYESATVDGSIKVNNYIIGDANDDGVISLADVLTIKKYLDRKNVTINKSAADVDGDGDVDNDDLVLLSKYCTGWDVTLGERYASGYRIISYYELGSDADGKWRYYYEAYNPESGLKEEDIPSTVSAEKATQLPAALEAGSVIEITGKGYADDSRKIGTVDLGNLVWIKSADEGSMTVVPVDSGAECKNCADAYVEGYTGTTYNDFIGNTHQSNVVTVTADTKFSLISYSNVDSLFKWGAYNSVDYADVISAKKNVLCYNDKSEDVNSNYKTTYATYVKAFVCVNDKNEAEFVIVVVNEDEAAAYNVACADCQ